MTKLDRPPRTEIDVTCPDVIPVGRRREANTTFDLTPQEVQVASFVTEGMTNREVAAQMFLSPRTIDYHLRNVFTKLGIKSRTELANRLAETSIAGSTGS